MNILIVARKKIRAYNRLVAPFVIEQGEALRTAGCNVHLFLIEPKGFLGYVRARKELKKEIVAFHPDVIHAHYGLSGITAVLQNKVPVVITFHNGETHNWYVNVLSSLFSLRAKHVIYVAQHIYDLVYWKHKNYTILPCGINIEECVITPYKEARKQLGWSDDKKYILFGGGFSDPRKNVSLLQKAVAYSKRSDIEIVEMKGLSRAECILRMCACDCFALPSHSEGSPQTIKEAMACNCPIVATDVADIAYLLGNIPGHYLLRNPIKRHDLWMEDEKSVSECAEAINNALSFKGRTKGRERIQSLGFDNKQIAERLIEIYKEIIAR